MENSKKGSFWRVWDLQVQTILDDDYIELKKYSEELKRSEPQKWDEFITRVGTEEDVLLWDSKEYFNNGDGSKKSRSDNYAKVFFSFLEVFKPELGCVAITDHNHIHPTLMDSLVKRSLKSHIKIIPGVEVNSDGVHMLLLFGKPPCQKSGYSEGIETFLAVIGVVNRKQHGDYMLTNKNVSDVMDEVSKENGLVIFAHCNSNNGLFQERGKTDRTHLANIFNKETVVLLQGKNYQKQLELKKYIERNNKLISTEIYHIASDARKLVEIGSPDEDGYKQFIKGEPGFEGLRQAMFESSSRMRVSKEQPVYPIHRIDNLEVKLPEETTINDDKFCLAGKYSIELHPNYTCFIGGRGTGKSTFLNLIHEKAFPGKNKFFSSKKIKVNGKVLSNLSGYVQLDNDSDQQEIEFISQNEIENFATDQNLLTNALFARIKRVSGDSFAKAINDLKNELDESSKYIDLLVLQDKVQKLRKTKAKEIEAKKKILTSFESEEYKKHEKKVAETSVELSAFQKSRERFEEIKKSLQEIYDSKLQFLDIDCGTSNLFDIKALSAQGKIKEVLEIDLVVDTEKATTEEERLKELHEIAKSSLRSYLQDKGLTKENMNDVSEANKVINDLQSEIAELLENEKVIKVNIEKYNSELEVLSNKFKTEIKNALHQLNNNLENLSDQVKKIELKLSISDEKVRESVFLSFKEKLKLDWSDANTKESSIKEYLFKIDFPEILKLDKDGVVEKIVGAKKPITKAQEYLTNLFSEDIALKVYKEVIKMHQSDIVSNQVINVLYDDKQLEKTSFGQRCTAALVLMLMLGNNPIIIDEPEGHLDSLLIANYLVNLIKKSKENRQIIFATHNANLVVNGDADLIYYLAMGDDGKTKVTPLTLEDISNRDKLVSLEGGDIAFLKREKKYKGI